MSSYTQYIPIEQQTTCYEKEDDKLSDSSFLETIVYKKLLEESRNDKEWLNEEYTFFLITVARMDRRLKIKNILIIFMILILLIFISIAIYLSYKLYCIENNNENIKMLMNLLEKNSNMIQQNNDIINRLLDKIYIY